MIQPTLITWILAAFGSLIYLLLALTQLLILFNPKGQAAKDILIGKGKDWRDRTHFKSAYAFAWADWLLVIPLLVAGNIGALTGHSWGYIIWIAVGAISIYFSIVFWVMEKEYTYPSYGALAYYTYFWGFYLYWGIAVAIYSMMRIQGV